MTEITARLPDELVAALDGAAAQLRRTRAEVVRQAIEVYLDDFEADARQHPQRIRAIPVDVSDRARELAAGVEIDLGAQPDDADR